MWVQRVIYVWARYRAGPRVLSVSGGDRGAGGEGTGRFSQHPPFCSCLIKAAMRKLSPLSPSVPFVDTHDFLIDGKKRHPFEETGNMFNQRLVLLCHSRVTCPLNKGCVMFLEYRR